jgi:DNA-binding winged helix-turn-helix (wHTH) protein
MAVRFGAFVLDSDTRRLQLEGRDVHLTPKAMELLELLVRSRPRAVSKTAIKRTLWPDAHVGAGSLTVLAAELRTPLGDDARRPTWIRTVFAFGYAFAGEATDDAVGRPGPATAVSSRPAPRVVWGGRTIPLLEGENVVGRDADVGVRIDVAGISRRHALIRVRGGEATIEDLGSKNGTHLHGGRLVAAVPLNDGDVFVLGDVALVFRSAPLTGATATVPQPGGSRRSPAV